jgi:menaquinol-cytochrome c reductase iron-sulfur subunit
MESSQAGQQAKPRGSRRSYLGVLLGVASAFVGALLAVPVLRYVLYPLTKRSGKSEWTPAGPLSESDAAAGPLQRKLEIKQQDGWRENQISPVIYLVKKAGQVQALSAICPHLGCTVPWDAGRKEFVCPCHGGAFGPDGAYISGPPLRGLDALETRVSGGVVQVKYQTFRPDVKNKQVTS